jgi:hypothetical protein
MEFKMADAKSEIDKVDLDAVKSRLKAGKLTADDLRVLETLVTRTEAATKMLRAAIVE